MNIQASVRVARRNPQNERIWLEPEAASVALDAAGNPKPRPDGQVRFRFRLLRQTGSDEPEDLTYQERANITVTADGRTTGTNYSTAFDGKRNNSGISLVLTTLRPKTCLDATWTEKDTATGDATGRTATVRVPVTQDGQQGDPGEDGKPGDDGKPGEDGKPGAPGEDAVSYDFYAEYTAIVRSADLTYTPAYLRVFVLKRVGSATETDQTWNEAANGRIQFRRDSGPWTDYGGNCITASTHTGANTSTAAERMDFRWTPADGVQRTVSVPVVSDGAEGTDGEPGCVYRMTEWATGTEYRNDSAKGAADTDGLKWIDVVVVRTGGNATTFDRYVCKQTHTSSGSNKPAGTDTAYWRKLNNLQPIYTPLLLADNAVLNLAQTNAVNVVIANRKVIAMGGNLAYPFRAGSGVDENIPAAQAPFRIDRNGKMYATGSEIAGTFTATWSGLTLTVADGSRDFMYVETEEGDKPMRFTYTESSGGGYIPQIEMAWQNYVSLYAMDGMSIARTNGSSVTEADTGISPGEVSLTGRSGQILTVAADNADGSQFLQMDKGTNSMALGLDGTGKFYMRIDSFRGAPAEVEIGEVFIGGEFEYQGLRGKYLILRTQ